jgi:signal transduction histidine kinase
MGGDLTVVSELGRGAEFTLTLPIGATQPLRPAELQR